MWIKNLTKKPENPESDIKIIDKQILWKKAGTSDHILRKDVGVRLPKDNTGTQALREGF